MASKFIKRASASAFAFVTAFAFMPQSAFAANVIEFPTEELATESVLPVFDHPVSVKNRIITTARRLELGVVGGYSLTEPFFNPLSVGGTATYHFNEDHAINFFGLSFLGGQSSYSRQLNSVRTEGGAVTNMKLELAPGPKYVALLGYQPNAFYGKISIAKDIVVHLHLYGLAGLGAVGIGDSALPAAAVGVGQKFYFNNSFALRFDLRVLGYNGPNITSRRLDNETKEQPTSSFDERLQFSTLLSLGAVYLLPHF